MLQKFHQIKVNTQGQDLYNFTSKVDSWIKNEKLDTGILNIKANNFRVLNGAGTQVQIQTDQKITLICLIY